MVKKKTISFLGLCEELSNEKFNLAEFGLIKSKVSYKSFTMSLYLFGMTANEWKQRYTDKAKYGNIRDYASLIELIILNTLGAINRLLIEQTFLFQTV